MARQKISTLGSPGDQPLRRAANSRASGTAGVDGTAALFDYGAWATGVGATPHWELRPSGVAVPNWSILGIGIGMAREAGWTGRWLEMWLGTSNVLYAGADGSLTSLGGGSFGAGMAVSSTGLTYSIIANMADAAIAAISSPLILRHRKTAGNVPAPGMGNAITLMQDTDTGVDRNAARIAGVWTTSTEGIQVADIVFYAVNGSNVYVEVARMKGGGLLTGTTIDAPKLAGNVPVATLPPYARASLQQAVFKTWSVDPLMASATVAPALGSLLLIKCPVRPGDVLSTITFRYTATTAAVGITSLYGVLYSVSGNLLAATANAFGTGTVSATSVPYNFTTPYTVPAGVTEIYAGILIAGTTAPTMQMITSQDPNAGLSATNSLRVMNSGSALAAPPATTPVTTTAGATVQSSGPLILLS